MAAHQARRARHGATWALGSAGMAALAHYLPSVCVLGQWSPVPLRALPNGWCRWRGPDDRPVLALTFDDGPDPDATPRTLDLLHELGMRATFFVLGSQAAAHPALVQEILRRGHAVGSHGQHHEHHLLRSPGWIARDLAESVDVLTAVTGRPPRWYRPTYGQLTASTVLQARRLDLEVVLWSVWGHEWSESEPAPVLGRLRGGLEPGAIVLLHDNDVSCPPGTAALTRRVLEELAAEMERLGLRSVALDDLLGVPPAPLTAVAS
ncbi:MAG TPA: polysaccharide deacetylase family protein [Acidimicrobiales bacterium]|nr:polysaccharide deacetylase family protein [Acidimicrobiales bacterium]